MAVVMAASLMMTPAELVSAGEIQEFQDGTAEVESYAEETDVSEQGENIEETAAPEDEKEAAEDLGQDTEAEEVIQEQEENREQFLEEPDEEVSEENLAGDFSDGEAENASQTNGNFTWYEVESEDCFYIEGSGNFSAANPPWGEMSKINCKKVVVNIKGMTDLSRMFEKMSSVEIIDFKSSDFSKVTNMGNMFLECKNLKQIKFGKQLNTSKVTNMAGMFSGCSSLQTLDVSGLDTSNVTNMLGMFSGCQKLQTLDVSGFKTSKVTDMGSMFAGCDSLQKLDLSKFNTVNATTMRWMFLGCKNLETLDLSSFNTSNVEDMGGMFEFCEKLQKLNVSGFKTSNVTDMNNMFHQCTKLQSLDVSGFDTSNVENMNGMFCDCINVQKLDVSRFNTAKVTNMSRMFAGISCLGTLNLKGFNTCEVKDMSFMFYCATGGETLDLNSFNTSNVNTMSYMFYGTKLNIFKPNFDMLRVSDATRMFQRTYINTLDLSGIKHVLKYINTSEMFDENHIQTLKTIHGLKVNKAIEIDPMYDDAGNTYTELPQERISITLKKKTPTPEPTAKPKPTAKPTATPKPAAKSIKKATIKVSACTYNGKAQSPTVKVVLGKTTLKKNVDYTLKYSNNKNAGTKAVVTVTGKGKYKDTVTKKFTIKPYTFNSKVTASVKSVTWNGKAQKPAVTLKWNGKTLKSGTDFTATYKKNKEPGKGSVTITGKGNFTGKKTASFTINKAKQPIKISPAKLTKTVKEKGKSYAVKITGRKESAKVTYSSANTKVAAVSKGKIVIKGKGSTTVTVKLAATKHYKAAAVKIPVQVNAAAKKNQVITTTLKEGGIYYYRSAPISLGAKLTAGDGKLTFSVSDTNMVKVDSKGNLTLIKNPSYYGEVRITITAGETANYKKTTKTITIYTAGKKPSGTLAERIKNVKAKFPVGKYWNHEVVTSKDLASFLNNGHFGGEYGDQKDKERFANTVSSVPCSDHKGEPAPGKGQYDCNYFGYSTGANGFARKLFYDVWGVRTSEMQHLSYDYNIEVGDLICVTVQANGEYIQPEVFVTGVNKTKKTVTGLWCDSEQGKCQIKSSEFKISSASERYHVNAY